MDQMVKTEEKEVKAQTFEIYCTEVRDCEEKTELKKVVCSEDEAKKELQRLIASYHRIYRINDPFEYERIGTPECRIVYKSLSHKKWKFIFWYREVIRVGDNIALEYSAYVKKTIEELILKNGGVRKTAEAYGTDAAIISRIQRGLYVPTPKSFNKTFGFNVKTKTIVISE